nr:MAG TPA: hypothetical protein [Caudoviricetes sp.]
MFNLLQVDLIVKDMSNKHACLYKWCFNRT